MNGPETLCSGSYFSVTVPVMRIAMEIKATATANSFSRRVRHDNGAKKNATARPPPVKVSPVRMTAVRENP
jgi:hypothetical protein